jgi:hypothetical protein
LIRQVGGDPAVTPQTDHSSSGCWGIHSCQAPSTSAADPAGYLSENTVTVPGAATVSKVNEVTMPKLPPPPPLSAQRRSPPSTVRCSPSAVTTWAAVSLSQVSPNLRAMTPSPPPRVSPPMPTVGHEPAGNARPASASAP